MVAVEEYPVRLIKSTVSRFHRLHGGDFQDLLSLANLRFCKACRKYDPTKGTKKSTYVVWSIWKELLEDLRSRIRHQKRKMVQIEDQGIKERASSTFCMAEFKKALSEDALYAVNAVSNPVLDIQIILKEKGRSSSTAIRSALREHLKDLGWSQEKIKRIFQEIKQTLEGE